MCGKYRHRSPRGLRAPLALVEERRAPSVPAGGLRTSKMRTVESTRKRVDAGRERKSCERSAAGEGDKQDKREEVRGDGNREKADWRHEKTRPRGRV